MKVIRAENVNHAYYRGLDLFQVPVNYRRQESRNGATLECNEPVTTVYSKPWQRVLFDKTRDANPFFHLVEAIWMIAGRRDLKTIIPFNSGMSNFSDDHETLNGAYGYRWLQYFGYDQIETCVQMLKHEPDSRRVVLQMWDAVHDLDSPSKDIPCNTNIFFKIREGKLNMMVCNRSNDMIWGAYGANAVHMSILQEYVAAAVGAEIGEYRQVSDSFHVYENELWNRVKSTESPLAPMAGMTLIPPYPDTMPVVEDAPVFCLECETFIERLDQFNWNNPEDADRLFSSRYMNSFLSKVLQPMVKAFIAHKQERNYVKAEHYLGEIEAEDWEIASRNWIEKRRANYEKKHG